MKRAIYFSSGFVLFLALCILWLPWLGQTYFYGTNEPQEAVVAMSMLSSGDWVLPVCCGTDIPTKPPFLAWIIAGLAWLFNGGQVNEYISRLPSALAAIAMVMATFSWIRKIRGEQFALFMSLILAGSIEVYLAAMSCRVDMLLTACMVGAMYLLFEARQHKGQDNFWRYAVAAVLLTCAVLTKGPVGAFLPCLVMGCYFVFRGDRFFPTVGRMAALCFFSCLIPAIWYYNAFLEGGDRFVELAWEENFGRLTGTINYDLQARPFWYCFIYVIVGMLPWTLLVIMAFGALRRLVQQPFKPAGILAATAAIVVIAFYCIPASKRSVYLLPAYPFLAYGVASIAEALCETRINTAFTRVLAILAIAAPAVIVATIWVPIAGFSFHAAHWWSWIVLAVPPVAAIGWLIQAMPRGNIGGAALIVWAMLVCYGGAVMPAAFNRVSAKEDARLISSIAGPRARIYTVGHREAAPSYCLNYYLDGRMQRIEKASDAARAPKGTVLIFPNRADTVGLSPAYHLSLLNEHSADTRHAMLFAVKTK